jgi:hypothetical protein
MTRQLRKKLAPRPPGWTSTSRGAVLEDRLALLATEKRRRPGPIDAARCRKDAEGHQDHAVMMDMIALAFQTDTTRIGTFMFGNAVSGRTSRSSTE